MKTMKEMREWVMDRWAAYHEAGHAVAALKIKGLRALERISIDEVEKEESNAGGFYSKSLLRDADPRSRNHRNRIRVEKEIMVAMAGGLAQERKLGSTRVRDHSRSDMEYAVELALYSNDDKPEAMAFLESLSIRAESLVESSWPMIEALAAELLKRRRMTGKELREWFDQWLRNGANAARLRRWQDKLSREKKTEERQLARAAREKQNGHRR